MLTIDDRDVVRNVYSLAAGMLEAEHQFRRVVGYRDLGKLAVAVEREVGAPSPPSPVTEEVRETVTV